eukprot:Nitzschia sp. Nitz4//scaffold166_size90379//12662//15701//NITZ4_005047-RA/size90379-processed-gene-0.104-mRNA-1//1//CDS//3329538166//3962//frame0
MHIVCAIGENLARETCVASVDSGTPVSIEITKQGNGQTYAETLAYLEALKPDEVLLNEGRKNSPLGRKIQQFYANEVEDDTIPRAHAASDQEPRCSTVVKFVPRSFFDQTKGAEMLRKLSRTDTYDATILEEYILLASSHAVLHYTQLTLGVHFSRRTLAITVNSGGGNRMAIDRSTLLHLELLTNAKTGKTKNSLVSNIDLTKTSVGTRLLRTSLIAPPCRSDTINARLDLVDTFLSGEDFFYSVLEQLKALPAMDSMLANIALVPAIRPIQGEPTAKLVITTRAASKGISALVCVKSTLAAIPAIATVLKEHLAEIEPPDTGNDAATNFTGRSSLLIGLGGGPCSEFQPHRHCLLKAIVQALCQPQLQEVEQYVCDVFTASTTFSRNPNAMRHQECFALKSKEDGMMEILRMTFLANVDDIYKKADEYAEVHGCHITVKYSTTRGYFLSVPGEMAAALPEVFIQPNKSGSKIYCTTEEVQSLNARAKENVQDLLLMTYERIQEVLDFARSKYDALAALSDAIALLDICHSFADKVSLSKAPWTRPKIVDFATSEVGMVIRNGRHGIEVADAFSNSSGGPSEIIPNDTFVATDKPFTVLSGINGSGKSTYLKQVAIIVLLAHCGSYVPAEEAQIPLRTRLCARMGTSDDQGCSQRICVLENNISSFMLEMKETAFICSNADDKSLVLLDELGRATSNEDGISLAWAVSEYLLSRGSMTFFVSHYPQICQLSEIYSQVQNQHLVGATADHGEGDDEIIYTHKLAPGPCSMSSNYGVEMATSCGWPEEVVDEAREIESSLKGYTNTLSVETEAPSGRPTSINDPTSIYILRDVSKQIERVLHDETSIESLRATLQSLKCQVVDNDDFDVSAVTSILGLNSASLLDNTRTGTSGSNDLNVCGSDIGTVGGDAYDMLPLPQQYVDGQGEDSTSSGME